MPTTPEATEQPKEAEPSVEPTPSGADLLDQAKANQARIQQEANAAVQAAELIAQQARTKDEAVPTPGSQSTEPSDVEPTPEAVSQRLPARVATEKQYRDEIAHALGAEVAAKSSHLGAYLEYRLGALSRREQRSVVEGQTSFPEGAEQDYSFTLKQVGLPESVIQQAVEQYLKVNRYEPGLGVASDTQFVQAGSFRGVRSEAVSASRPEQFEIVGSFKRDGQRLIVHIERRGKVRPTSSAQHDDHYPVRPWWKFWDRSKEVA